MFDEAKYNLWITLSSPHSLFIVVMSQAETFMDTRFAAQQENKC